MTDVDFEYFRRWASRLAETHRTDGEVDVLEPKYPNGAITVGVTLSRTLAQVLLWATGMLELRVIAIESGAEVATEVHELEDRQALSLVLQHAEDLVEKTQASE